MILSLRDEALARHDCNRLRAHQIPALEAPVHKAVRQAYDKADIGVANGFILTSQQAAIALPETDKDRPVFAVGRASAASARARGYQNVTWGPSDGAALGQMIAAQWDGGQLCWLRAAKISFDIAGALRAADIAISEAVVYEMAPQTSWRQEVVDAFAQGAVTAIMVLSKAQREALVQLLHHHDLWHHIPKIDYYAVSPAVAEAAKDDGWQAIHIARRKRAISVQAAVIVNAREKG